MKIYKKIAMYLLQDHKLYGKFVKTRKSLKTYAELVKIQIHIIN